MFVRFQGDAYGVPPAAALALNSAAAGSPYGPETAPRPVLSTPAGPAGPTGQAWAAGSQAPIANVLVQADLSGGAAGAAA